MVISAALLCMSLNVYFEARSEHVTGQAAVAEVTLNRVRDDRYPNDVCSVVKQESKGTCQFSWYCDGKSDQPKDEYAFIVAQWVSYNVMHGKWEGQTHGSTHYHAKYIRPYWAKDLDKTVTIGTHIFYKWK